MLVVSLALAAVLVAADDDGDDGGHTALAEASPVVGTPSDGSTPAGPPEATPIPPLPFALQERLDRLPEKLRNETLQAYSTGTLGLPQLEQIVTDFENRNPSVRVGSVLDSEAGRLRFEVFTTGEELDVATGEQTLVRRGNEVIELEDLHLDELVMVVTTGGGTIALTIEAFGVAAP